MKQVFTSILLFTLLACRSPETSPLLSFQASCSIDIQEETKDFVIKSHNSFHPGCKVNGTSLHLKEFRTIMIKNDSEDYVPTSVIGWEIQGCSELYYYETRIQQIRRHQDPSEKNYGITIEPVYKRSSPNSSSGA